MAGRLAASESYDFTQRDEKRMQNKDYTDISQREQLAAAIKRWPLLAEFAQQQ